MIVPHIEPLFVDEGRKYNMDFRHLLPDEAVPRETTMEYFMVEYYDAPGGIMRRLFHEVRGKHYMQFGRHVAAMLLGMVHREHWKVCVVPFVEETAMTQAFRSGFQPFDFTTTL